MRNLDPTHGNGTNRTEGHTTEATWLQHACDHTARQPRRRTNLRLLVLLVALCGAAVLFVGQLERFDNHTTHPHNQLVWTTTTSSGPPPTGTDGNRVGHIVVADNHPSWAPTAERADGKPVGYDPCRPIHIVLAGQHAPHWAEDILHNTLAQLEAATGLVFNFEGYTTETATPDREPYQPDRYGDRWAPVLVAWTDPDVVDELAGAAGLGGSVMITYDNQDPYYVTGIAYLNHHEIGDDQTAAETILLHELGHVVGLDHVDDDTQLMYPTAGGNKGLGDGDRAGLAALGSIPCAGRL